MSYQLEKYEAIYTAYVRAFGNTIPMPIGVDQEGHAAVLEAHLKKNTPVPADYNWYPDLPEGAIV
jgi:hypothetical protein